MSGFFGDGSGPQPPKILRSPIEQASVLNQLREQSKPLTLIFQERNQRFLTYLAAIDKQGNRLALDELVPEEGQRMLVRGDAYRIDVYLEGVHIHWKSSQMPTMGQHEGYPAAWFGFPQEITYHQKRGAFRARTLLDEPVRLTLAGAGQEGSLHCEVADLSATGCKARLALAETGLQPGQALTNCQLTFPGGQVALAIEVRHVRPDENKNSTTLGLKFLSPDGMAQRNIERYVNHLQREARRRQEGDIF